ncbi:hypothetical protein [Arthrobacter sp. SLBN-112]|uniref:hypothetical protein n=1 Tax=Arthrobacter sp. SLBN-112 TaxID=2768452 RepID=UPI0027B6604D|nr:hypothetical protein [Arthrobacter sp. SLBN-112]MDQ0802120.1 hypothetical protein [Arthrobacter sp. SLBN-112]
MPSQEPDTGNREGLPLLWAVPSSAAAVLGLAGSAIGLLAPELIYGRETPVLFNASIAQDLVNLFLVAPMTLILATVAARGRHPSSWLCLNGFLAFTAYNYAIYAFSVHFGPLFLLWVAVLGLSVFAAAGSMASILRPDPKTLFRGQQARFPAWTLIATSALFTLLWLSEIVPDLLAGRPSTSAAYWAVPTNPVHVLDLALFLPGVFASGILLLRRRRIGYASAVASLVFLGVTCLPILVIPFVTQARGEAATWFILLPIGLIAATTLAALWRLLLAARPAPAVDGAVTVEPVAST